MGMRRAKKEGNWSGRAPLGYKNKTYEDGKKYIAPEEPYASAIRWAFQELSLGMSSMAEVHRKAFKLGLTCSINNFHSLVRNWIYCGKIRVREIDGEEEHIIKGLHEPLITERLFDKVQNVLKGDVKPKKSAIATPEDLPLRGFLRCPNCHRMLTGSASKGRKTYVAYYHCKSPCKVRFNANQVNQNFIKELKLFRIAKRDQPKFLQEIISTYNEVRKTASAMRQDYIDELHILDYQSINARELLLAGKIEPSDFKNLKMHYDSKVRAINLKLTALKERFEPKINIQPLVINAIKTLCYLPRLYQTATIEDKRYLVETIFIGMLIYDKDGYRTMNINSIAEITYLETKSYGQKKMGQKSRLKTLPHKGWNMGLEPTTS
ncbi:recombinase family protein [Arcticibacter pallidicorallinus]|uniref:recombinase family protein n=1 Tax=Arcticibacter pallidicorallinus TaxID=1259464 RepID=UPI00318346F1